MSKKTEALKLALEALEESLGYVEEEVENAQRLYGQYPTRQARIQGLKDDARKHMNAITAIREALAEQPAQQQEPVAWLYPDNLGRKIVWLGAKKPIIPRPDTAEPLYTFPQPSKPWVELTDEEIETAMPSGIYDCLADPWDCGVGDGDEMRSIKNDVVRIARAIEAKLKEKNA